MYFKKDKCLELINKYLVKDDKWVYFIKRIIYVCCFINLTLMDQVIGSATGYIQFGIKNYTFFIVGILVLTTYKWKDFCKVPYIVWIIGFVFFRILTLDWLKEKFYNDLEVETNLWCVGILGIIIIRMFYLYVLEKKKPRINPFPFSIGILMLLAMAIIRPDYAWPKALLLICLIFYITDFKEKDMNNLLLGMLEGIIIGFFIIQTQAWMYRPYDKVRYEGMYSHPNINALLYLCTYCAALGKWYYLKLKKKNIIFRIPCILLIGLVIGTMFFTGGRAAAITGVALTMVFLIFQMISRKRWKIMELLIDGSVLCFVIAISILPSYWLIRYIPPVVNEPLYFETDYHYKLLWKVLKDEPIDSEKYVELNEAMDEMFERYLWFMPAEQRDGIEDFIRNFPDSLRLSIKVEAAALEDSVSEEEIIPGSDSEHPLIWSGEPGEGAYDVRVDIYRYFWDKLTLIGKPNVPQGVWLKPWIFANHCHNLFLQMAYDFGIIVGVVFIFVVLMLFVRVIWGLIKKKNGPNYFRLFVVSGYSTIFIVFGMLEMDWIYGQLPFILYFLMLYPLFHKDFTRVQNMNEKKKYVDAYESNMDVNNEELVIQDLELYEKIDDSEVAMEDLEQKNG